MLPHRGAASHAARVIVVLAVLTGATAANQCASEAACAQKACSPSFAASTAAFPYTATYTTTGDAHSTTFVWKVCSSLCSARDQFCQPLKSIQLRLADTLLDVPAATTFKVPPPGLLLRACTGDGPGLLLNSTDLKSLATSNPSKAPSCSLFSMSLDSSQGQLTLSDICQQRVALVNQKGAVVYDQPPSSCMYVAKLADGTSGFGVVNDKHPRLPPASPQPYGPSSPEPSPSVALPSPSLSSPGPTSPLPSPSEHSPQPKPYSPIPYFSLSLQPRSAGHTNTPSQLFP